jgi:hypothetical protein
MRNNSKRVEIPVIVFLIKTNPFMTLTSPLALLLSPFSLVSKSSLGNAKKFQKIEG